MRHTAPVLVFCGAILGCNPETASAPIEGNIGVRAAWSVGDPAPYDGVLVPGVFKVCTAMGTVSRSYTITWNGSPGKWVEEVTVPAGQCVIVFQAKKNTKKSEVPLISVTSESPNFGVVVIDGECSEDCEILPTPQSATLAGFDGAIAKFYYTFIAGGHGGTGTLSFSVD